MATIRENSNNKGDALASVETEHTMAVGDDFLGTLNGANDNDWVRVELTAGVTYIIKLTGEGSGGAEAEDPIVEVRDANGKLIVQNDDISEMNRDSQLEFTPAEGGVYYINARSYNLNAATDNSGAYKLEVDAKPDPTADRTLPGTSGQDKLTGGVGDDTLTGLGGNDVLIGGAGDDDLDGGAGDDVLTGGAGADKLDGGAGTDTAAYEDSSAGVIVRLHSGVAKGGDAEGDALSNIENLVGSAHDDKLAGDREENVLTGGAGDDLLFGREDDDTLNGGAGDDSLEGDEGTDMLNGGQGADTLDGGAGTDTASYAGSGAGVTVRLHSRKAKGGDAQGDVITFDTVQEGGEDKYVSTIENLTGSDHRDILAGDDRDNTIDGGAGNDLLFGLAGADTLNGGDGNDTLRGGAGGDTLDGGHDDDTFHGGKGADKFEGGAAGDRNGDGDMIDEGEDGGTDTVSYAESDEAVTANLAGTGSGGHAQGDTYSNIENLIGSSKGDTLTGDNGDNMLNGGGGVDTLNGGAGDDTLDGGGGASNALNGDSGDDTFIARAGVDDMDGGLNSDTVSYVHSNERVRVELTADAVGEDGYASGDTYDNIENAIGSNYDDRLVGGTDNNVLTGGGGADTLDGKEGGDTASYAGSSQSVSVDLSSTKDTAGFITGSGGDAEGDKIKNIEHLTGSDHGDTLTGDHTTNTLNGGAGNDTLNGGAGMDMLIGGAGADVLHGGDEADNDPDTEGVQADTGTVDTASYAGSKEAVMIHLVEDKDYYTGSGGDAEGDRIKNDIEAFTGSANDNTLSLANGDTVSFAGLEDTVLVDFTDTTENVTINAGESDERMLHVEDFENIIGGDGTDTLTGDDADNRIEGGGGADTINGGDGGDMLIGGSGADALDGGAHTGTDGDTVSYAGSNRGVRIDLGVATAQEGGHAEGDTLANIENVIGSAHDDRLIGNTNNNMLTGGAGDDTLVGGSSSADTFIFSAGDGKDEILDFGTGADKIDLSSFEDVAFGDLTIDTVGTNKVISVGDIQITLTALEGAPTVAPTVVEADFIFAA